MTWPEARIHARAGRRVRRLGWTDRWIVFFRFRYFVQPVNPVTLVDGLRREVNGASTLPAMDWKGEDFEADDFTLDPIPPHESDLLGRITCSDALAATVFSFGTFAAGTYRVVFERGAMYYVAGNKNQLRVNAYSTSVNGFKIVSGGIEHNAPGFNAGPADTFRYDEADPRSEAELLADIAEREGGKETVFEHPGGDIAMYLLDDYINNAPSIEMPTFGLYAAG
jgi:hypothetical protein